MKKTISYLIGLLIIPAIFTSVLAFSSPVKAGPNTVNPNTPNMCKEFTFQYYVVKNGKVTVNTSAIKKCLKTGGNYWVMPRGGHAECYCPKVIKK